MKRLCFGIMTVFSAAIFLISAQGNIASAQSGCNDDGYDSITLKVPDLETAANYVVWSRMQIPAPERSSYRLEINDKCYEVGGSQVPVGAWEWVGFHNNDKSQVVNYEFKQTDNNSVRLIGNNPGVRIDQVLFIKDGCVPVDTGDNCRLSSAPAVDIKSATLIPPVFNQAVSGPIKPSPTITSGAEAIESVEYFEGPQHLQTVEGAGALDTTLLSNGRHRISMRIINTNGIIQNEVTELEINNEQHVLSPLQRWARLNKRMFTIISLVIGLLIAGALALFVRYRILLRRRLLRFHGF